MHVKNAANLGRSVRGSWPVPLLFWNGAGATLICTRADGGHGHAGEGGLRHCPEPPSLGKFPMSCELGGSLSHLIYLVPHGLGCAGRHQTPDPAVSRHTLWNRASGISEGLGYNWPFRQRGLVENALRPPSPPSITAHDTFHRPHNLLNQYPSSPSYKAL